MAMIYNNHGFYPQIFRCDRGSNYNTKLVKKRMHDYGVQQQFADPGTHGQNGHAEKRIDVMERKAVASLHTAGLGKKFLRNAIEYVVAVENRLPGIGKDSPINTFFSTTGQWRTIPRMAPFGCRALALIPQHLRKKEHKVRREECILLGLADGSKNGYRLLKMVSP